METAVPRKIVENELIKSRVSFMNNFANGMIITGVIGPYLTLVHQEWPPASWSRVAVSLFFMGLFFFLGWTIHLAAEKEMQKLAD